MRTEYLFHRGSERRSGDSGQATLAGLIAIVVILALGGALAAIAAAVSTHGDRQRAADLAALAGARALYDAQDRIFAPAGVGRLDRDGLLDLARIAAERVARANGARSVRVRFPDAAELLPTRVAVLVSAPLRLFGRELPVEAAATAALSPTYAAPGAGASLAGEYAGPLATRQGRPMRPDVALAFDRMAAAARADGVDLIVVSGYRSNAEQAVLFAAHPDPKWVAPPGRSLHRLGTELDLGPSGAYRWLAANAGRFGFVQRYDWEPWHYGLARAAGSRSVGYGPPEGAPALPAFVPARFVPMIVAAAQRWNVGAALLAAQIQQESGFDPLARSGAGAGGISQFMPETAARYGLSDADRFDPAKAIMAQAHHMHDLLAQFGAVPLALAAYNAGPLPVRRCGCIPPYRETQAYVAAIMALLAGGGDVTLGYRLDVRLVK